MERDRQGPEVGGAPGPVTDATGSATCPYCAQPIHPNARMCPHCHAPLSPELAWAASRPTRTSGLAVAALVLAIVAFVVCPVIPAVIALFLAASARKEIRSSGGAVGGEGLATAGRILAIINLALVALAAAFFAVVLFPSHRSNSVKVPTIALPTSPFTSPRVSDTAPLATAPGASSVPVLTAPGSVGCPSLDGSSPHYTRFSSPSPTCIDPTKHYTATIVTDVGAIVVDLNTAKAPKTVNNYIFLAGYHFYDGIVFHRVLPGFVDQGGDPTGTGSGGPGYQFDDELPSPGDYHAGSLVMANAGPNTNGSQFFFVVSDSAARQLVQAVGGKADYSLFGQVTSGMDVVLKINGDGANDPSPPNVPHRMVRVTVAPS